MTRLAVALTAVLFALAPAAARAACAIPDLDAAPVDVLARPLPGPSVPGGSLLSPASFAVVLYQKGKGPPVIPVSTGATLLPGGSYRLLGEGLFPHPGELWRLYGSFGAGGGLQSGTCDGPRAVPPPSPPPALTANGRSVEAVDATFTAHTLDRAPRVRVDGASSSCAPACRCSRCARCAATGSSRAAP